MGNSQSCCVFASRGRLGSSGSYGGGPSSSTSGSRGKKGNRSNGGRHSGHGRQHISADYVPGSRDGNGGASNSGLTHHPDVLAAAAASNDASSRRDESVGNLQHISEREPDDWAEDPSLHPTTETLFMEKSKQSIQSKKQAVT